MGRKTCGGFELHIESSSEGKSRGNVARFATVDSERLQHSTTDQQSTLPHHSTLISRGRTRGIRVIIRSSKSVVRIPKDTNRMLPRPPPQMNMKISRKNLENSKISPISTSFPLALFMYAEFYVQT
jgi:hypothetical protein